MTISNGLPQSSSDVIAIQKITAAVAAVDSAKRGLGHGAVSSAKGNLRAVIQSANDQGLSWQCIGDTLGIRRGCAYQRFRRGLQDMKAGPPAEVQCAVSPATCTSANAPAHRPERVGEILAAVSRIPSSRVFGANPLRGTSSVLTVHAD